MAATSTPDYGVDGWAYLVGFLGAGTLLVAVGFVLATRMALAGAVVTGLGALALVPGLWGLHYVRIGKFRHRDRLLDRIDWRADERCLDVGTGGGLMAIGAARRAPRGTAVGIDVWNADDLSGNGPARAKKNAALEGVADRVDVRTQDARSLPFRDGDFDAVFAVLCLHNIEPDADRRRALVEIARVLAPGGRAVISDLAGTTEQAAALRDSGLDVQEFGPFWDTFPPQRVVVATKPTLGTATGDPQSRHR
jgi:SAM-dependent methyltransferase